MKKIALMKRKKGIGVRKEGSESGTQDLLPLPIRAISVAPRFSS
jgi:hypothetical protein